MSTKACLTNISSLGYRVQNAPSFKDAISAFEYVEKHDFKCTITLDMELDERKKFARWCMGVRCKENNQVYVPA